MKDLYLIEWLDSFGVGPSWQEIGDLSAAEPLVCRSVGWVLRNDKKLVIVVPHMSAKDHAHSNQQGCGDMSIPKSCIKSMTKLRKAKT